VSDPDLTGENRCWPCTIANSVVGLLVAWVPLTAASVSADSSSGVIFGTAVWGVLVTAYTGYRLLALGYLPYSERIAKRTGLHERVGPARKENGR
jgi:hypothetical protein